MRRALKRKKRLRSIGETPTHRKSESRCPSLEIKKYLGKLASALILRAVSEGRGGLGGRGGRG